MYCTSAIVPSDPMKPAERLSLARPSIGPKDVRSIVTVRKVEQAIIAALKKCTLSFLQTRNEEQKPAAGDTKTAASPPQNNIVRKINESFTVSSDWMVGIRITSRAPTKTINRKRTRKRTLS